MSFALFGILHMAKDNIDIIENNVEVSVLIFYNICITLLI